VTDSASSEPGGRIQTLPPARTDDAVRRARNWRRVGITALWIFVLAGLSGFLGVRMATTSATADGWTVAVHAPQITRGALDAPITIAVSRDTGFGEKVTLRVDRTLFEHLDVNLIAPAPSAETGSADTVDWTFDPPPDSHTLTITIDTRMSPSEMPGEDRLGFAVIVRGAVVVETHPRLVLLP
jgi:hypothetical protein